jgi:hypothetical protein
MAITISQIHNADLRQMATRIDNGDGKINHQELQELISGVAKLQIERFEQKTDFDNDLVEACNKEDKHTSWGVLGSMAGMFGGAAIKGIKGFSVGAVLGIGAMIFTSIKSAIEKNEIEDNKEALKNDENLNSMAAEVKELVSQMAEGSSSEDIAHYLAKHDNGKREYTIAAKTWNDYSVAVYGNLMDNKKPYKQHGTGYVVGYATFDPRVKEYMPLDRAEKSLDKYDAKMAEIKNGD